MPPPGIFSQAHCLRELARQGLTDGPKRCSPAPSQGSLVPPAASRCCLGTHSPGDTEPWSCTALQARSPGAAGRPSGLGTPVPAHKIGLKAAHCPPCPRAPCPPQAPGLCYNQDEESYKQDPGLGFSAARGKGFQVFFSLPTFPAGFDAPLSPSTPRGCGTPGYGQPLPPGLPPGCLPPHGPPLPKSSSALSPAGSSH